MKTSTFLNFLLFMSICSFTFSQKSNTIIQYESGAHYEGEVENGIPSGKGTMHWSNGDK